MDKDTHTYLDIVALGVQFWCHDFIEPKHDFCLEGSERVGFGNVKLFHDGFCSTECVVGNGHAPGVYMYEIRNTNKNNAKTVGRRLTRY